MPTAIHSFSQEEIMAYLDGELQAERALAAAEHLEQCRECQRLAADFESVSRRLVGWDVEPVRSVPPWVEPVRKQVKRAVAKRPWFVVASVSGVLLVAGMLDLVVRPQNSRYMKNLGDSIASQQEQEQGNFVPNKFVGREPAASAGLLRERSGIAIDGAPIPDAPNAAATGQSGPLIVRTATLAVTSKSFDQSRVQVEGIARLNQGYLSQLELTTPNDAGPTLSATLRVPAGQLDKTLDELRRLGHVEGESQHGEDVTQRYVDMNARLANLRTTEGRLQQMLRDRTGRLSDVLQVEEAVDRTRGQIEETEAEQKSLSGQIALATVRLRITEEYKAALASGETSALTRLRNAAVAGCRNVVEGAMGVLELVLSIGPSLIILAAIAFFPVRRWWRLRSRTVAN